MLLNGHCMRKYLVAFVVLRTREALRARVAQHVAARELEAVVDHCVPLCVRTQVYTAQSYFW